ncbi:MAG: universal stress protein [Candidatus Eremiobacteraeota bacterium]|nr:universal stress protein [Candidatus Eremiobacteraeota bacterium]MCW5872950.1 universal stress protein [Candidatus Eremiobacteraeota bacterium]
MFSKILVPLDGSLQGEAALEPARYLASPNGPEIVLLRSLGPAGSASAYSRELRRCERYLKQLAQELVQSGLKASWQVLDVHDDPAADLLEAIRRHQADLVIMTSHGRRGVQRLLRGSVAEKLLRRASCPVLVVGRHSRLLQTFIRNGKEARHEDSRSP